MTGNGVSNRMACFNSNVTVGSKIGVVCNITNTPADSWVNVQNGYDWIGRRTSKTVSNWNQSASTWAQTTQLGFVYNGWNLVGELGTNAMLLKSHVWGPDASGSLQGAGGVGGLAATVFHNGPYAGTYFPTYDGNHNIVAYVRAADGVIVAEYEYSPFGVVIRATGPMAREFNFLFSTKYYDWETKRYYYGYRFFEPEMEKWMSRDPIEEQGGVNLYGFVNNAAVNRFDNNGLLTYPVNEMPLVRTMPRLQPTVRVGTPVQIMLILLAETVDQTIELSVLERENAETEAGFQEAELLLPELKEDSNEPKADNSNEPKAYQEVARKTDPKTCCTFIWDAHRKGGNLRHEAYTSRLFNPNYELIVVAPDGDSARYDSGAIFPKPVTAAYEAKTGRVWSWHVQRPKWSFVQQRIFDRDMVQFAQQYKVATKCKLTYRIFFRDEDGLRGYQKHAPIFAPYYSH